MEKYFKVGQTVWDLRFGEGVVTGDESLNVYYPIIVRFGFGYAEQSYTADGKHITGCLYISLFQTAPIITPNVPIVEFEQGELVWVKRDNDYEWCARYFSHQEEEYYFCFCAQKKGGSRHPWKNISKLNDIQF